MAAKKTCRANIGSRTEPRLCGQPIAKGMLAACAAHKTTMIPCESHIYYRGGSYVVLTVHRGKQRKTFHGKLDEAREARGDRTGSQKQAPGERRPFDEYALAWVAAYQGRTKRGFDEDTRISYRRALELYAIPHLGSTPMRDISREQIDELIAELVDKGLSADSIAKYIAPVRAMLSDLRERHKIPHNPASALKINKKSSAGKLSADQSAAPGRLLGLTRVELDAVIAATPDAHRLLIRLLAHTGCRISEALGLDWSDLGDDGRMLRIERQWYRGKLKQYTKSANGQRTISLPPELSRALWAAGADATGPMFHTRTGRRLSDRNINRTISSAAERAGLAHISAHSFRHTHGSLLLSKGWPITEVAHRLGDNVQTVQQVYAHKLRDSNRDLSFLDVGNAWANEHPETDANPTSLDSAEMSA